MTPYYEPPRQRRFVHVGFNPRTEFTSGIHLAIQNYLDRIADSDWYRYAAQNYVVWTNKDLTSLSRELTEQPGLQNFYFLATEFGSPQCDGMMPKQFWDWLNKTRLR